MSRLAWLRVVLVLLGISILLVVFDNLAIGSFVQGAALCILYYIDRKDINQQPLVKYFFIIAIGLNIGLILGSIYKALS